MEVLVIGGAAIVVLIVVAVFFTKPEGYDPTRAKIPDHMKRSVAWKQHEKEKEAERKRRRNIWLGGD